MLRAALTMIVCAYRSWRPCLVGLCAVVTRSAITQTNAARPMSPPMPGAAPAAWAIEPGAEEQRPARDRLVERDVRPVRLVAELEADDHHAQRAAHLRPHVDEVRAADHEAGRGPEKRADRVDRDEVAEARGVQVDLRRRGEKRRDEERHDPDEDRVDDDREDAVRYVGVEEAGRPRRRGGRCQRRSPGGHARRRGGRPGSGRRRRLRRLLGLLITGSGTGHVDPP